MRAVVMGGWTVLNKETTYLLTYLLSYNKKTVN